MWLFPQNLDIKLGFDKIRAMLVELAASDLGRKQVDLLKPISKPHLIEKLLEETAEQQHQLETGSSFPELNAFPLEEELAYARVDGYQLSGSILFQLKFNLELTEACSKHFMANAEDYPLWNTLSNEVVMPKDLMKELDRVFDRQGSVKDGASPELQDLRRQISRSEQRARKNLEGILREAKSSGYTDDSSALTLREGRLVLPLQAEHKRRIKGVILDESATGKTVFLEPLEVFNLNNTIRELQFAERREINRILKQLTAIVAPHLAEIARCQEYLAHLDFTRAKARLAIRLQASKPAVSKKPGINLKNARHPLLQVAHKNAGLPIIPLNLTLSRENRVMIISGPNAGGKSVCLKTVGLLQLMFQAGLLIPADEGTELGCYEKILVDIGDQQSLENDLSTYSSHLKNMNRFIKEVNPSTLFLIDEFGSGTEPNFGGPIAEAILEFLVAQQAYGLVTTHYSNLKEFGENIAGVQNGAMRFDLEQLEPMFILDVGRPGSSFALEIASKTGFPDNILQKAKDRIGQDQVAYEKLVNKLEDTRNRFQQKLQHQELLQKSLDQQRKAYTQLHQEIKDRKKELLNAAKSEARQILSEANQKIEQTIRTIKENRAEKETTKAARNQLTEYGNKIKPAKKAKIGPNDKNKHSGPIKPGDMVRIIDNQAQGEVISISGKWAEVRLGSLKSKIKVERLEKIGSKPSPIRSSRRSGIEVYTKNAGYSSELDVRGKRGEEALQAVINFIDEGSMLDRKNLRIVHGKGDGILRQLIREFLQKQPTVTSFKSELPERGGDGVTLVQLK